MSESAHKKARAWPWLPLSSRILSQLDLMNSYRLRPFGPFFHFEGHLFSLAQRSKTLSNNCRMMDENITLILGLDETITLLVIEPLYTTFRHLKNPFMLTVTTFSRLGYFESIHEIVLSGGWTDLARAPKNQT